MLKTVQTIGLIFPLSVLIFAGCTKEDSGKLKPGKESPHYARSIDLNDGNPLNYVGEEFTYALDSIAGSDYFSDPSNQKSYDVVTSYLEDNLDGLNQLDKSTAEDHLQNGIPDSIGNKSEFSELDQSYFNDYCKDNASLSSDFKGYLDKLSDQYENYASESDFLDDLESIESDIKGDGNLTNDEQDALLAGFAVARNSLGYLNDAKNDSDDEWHSEFTNNLSNGEEEPFMLNVSHYAVAQFFLVYDEKSDNLLTLDDSIHSGNVQSAFDIGPLITDDSNQAY